MTRSFIFDVQSCALPAPRLASQRDTESESLSSVMGEERIIDRIARSNLDLPAFSSTSGTNARIFVPFRAAASA
jgi:hypothetical protein